MGVSRTMRVPPPSSYLMKIKSFTLLLKDLRKEKYMSAVFEAGGYRWRLVLYPNGNKNANENGYISLYLAIQDSNLTSKDWEVYADVKFFVYNQTQRKFLTLHDEEPQRFHAEEKQRGIAKVLPLATFNDSNNGYLVNDSCAFGIEIYVMEPSKNQEEFHSVKPNSDEATFTWKTVKFSILDKEFYNSQEFTAAGVVWKLQIYPKGTGNGKGKWLSLFLVTLGYGNNKARNQTVYAHFKLRVLDRRGNTNLEREYTIGFFRPTYGWGESEFMPLADLQNPSKGFLVNDALIVQTELLEVSQLKRYS